MESVMSRLIDVGREIAKNAAMTIPAVRKFRLRGPRAGVRFTGRDDELRRYAFEGLDLIAAVHVDVAGKTVIEIGPGDFLTSGLAMLAAGATSYAALDRFVGDYSQLAAKDWYLGIEQAWPRLYPDIPWPSWLDASRFPEGYPERVRTLDTPIERARRLGHFDIVCSFQVGEHVADITAFAEANAALLKPDGGTSSGLRATRRLGPLRGPANVPADSWSRMATDGVATRLPESSSDP
jgi:hypothetical protein